MEDKTHWRKQLTEGSKNKGEAEEQGEEGWKVVKHWDQNSQQKREQFTKARRENQSIANDRQLSDNAQVTRL